MKKVFAWVGVCAGLAAAGAALQSSSPSAADESKGLCAGTITCLDQGWAEHERSWWYSVPQGSQLLPLEWILALEQPASDERILNPVNVERFGYLTNPKSRDNPHGLPVGFAVDKEEGTWTPAMCGIFGVMCARETMRAPWVGMTCAACHTGQFTFGTRTVRVEGAPTLADFQGFMEQMLAALRATRTNETKFARFAATVLRGNRSGEAAEALKNELDEQIAWQTRVHKKNASSLRYGFGRLDAQGHILNKVSLVVGVDAQRSDFPADAPASYPQIWNAPQHDKLQWNGIAENKFKFTIFGKEHDLGALVRNTAEVIGVFAQIEVDPQSDTEGYASSLRLSRMIEIERQLGRLQSPRWPGEILGAIDRDKAAEGESLFLARCVGCHAPLASGDTRKRIKAVMTPLDRSGTDIWTACNTYLHTSDSGRLQGRKQLVYTGDPLQKTERTRLMLAHTAIAAIAGRADELVGQVVEDTIGIGRELPRPARIEQVEYLPGVPDGEKKARARTCLENKDAILAYKARPLNGIWATAPYLHNGSVPTLRDLLLPSSVRTARPALHGEASSAGTILERRPERFTVSLREYDPIAVGIKTVRNPPEREVADASGRTFTFNVRDADGAPVPGNFNSGHEGPEYGTDNLADAQRDALLEYLKTL